MSATSANFDLISGIISVLGPSETKYPRSFDILQFNRLPQCIIGAQILAIGWLGPENGKMGRKVVILKNFSSNFIFMYYEDNVQMTCFPQL
jgi:hypothetical protein